MRLRTWFGEIIQYADGSQVASVRGIGYRHRHYRKDLHVEGTIEEAKKRAEEHFRLEGIDIIWKK